MRARHGEVMFCVADDEGAFSTMDLGRSRRQAIRFYVQRMRDGAKRLEGIFSKCDFTREENREYRGARWKLLRDVSFSWARAKRVLGARVVQVRLEVIV